MLAPGTLLSGGLTSFKSDDAYMRQCKFSISTGYILSPFRRQATISNNHWPGCTVNKTIKTTFTEYQFESHTFSFNEIHLKIVFAKNLAIFSGVNDLRSSFFHGGIQTPIRHVWIHNEPYISLANAKIVGGVTSISSHRHLGAVASILKIPFSNSFYIIVPWAFAVTFVSGECHRTTLMRSHHSFR